MAVASKWLRGPCDERAAELGYWVDEDAGLYVCEFLERFCRQSKGEWAGRLIKLLDWQRDFITRLYAWKRPDGLRRFRTAYLEVPKKNGKSTVLSGLSLYHLLADEEPGAEVYNLAYDRSQAGIVFGEALNMVRSSPALSKQLTPVESRKIIVHEASASKLQALSADVPSKDGFNASFTVFDELHRQRTDAMWRIFKYAGASRRQPLLLSITTAGSDRQSVCYRQHDYTKKVNSGLVEDLAHLGVIYGAEESDDWTSPELWKRVNPSWGVTLQPEVFASEVQKAKEFPAELNDFLRLRLNIWTAAAVRFLPRDKWDACGGPVSLEEVEQLDAFGGLDLASTTDLASFCLVFPDEDGLYRVLIWFFAPEETADLRERRDGVPYRAWARDGLLTLTEGPVIDYDFIERLVLLCCERFNVRKIFCDPWNATQLATRLREAGVPLEFLRQGFASLSGPTKELERLVLCGQLRHGNHPILNWCCDNAMVVTDPAGNKKLSKEKSTEKIDGMVALVDGIAAATSEVEAGVIESGCQRL